MSNVYYVICVNETIKKIPVSRIYKTYPKSVAVLCEGYITKEDMCKFIIPDDVQYIEQSNVFHVHAQSVSFLSGEKNIIIMCYNDNNKHHCKISSGIKLKVFESDDDIIIAPIELTSNTSHHCE